MFERFTEQVRRGEHLTAGQITEAVELLTNPDCLPIQKAAFLEAFARKGETVDEISAFVRALRKKSIEPPLDPKLREGTILDVCGTGGDQAGTFNISTAVAIVVAAAGIPVAKHGNRAITSKSGSADVLEALGVRIDLSPVEAARSLRDKSFAFFFAPAFHPAFKHIAPARRLCAEKGQRTIFNILGPLLNPARPNAQLIGVPRPELCDPIARVLQTLDVRYGMVACGALKSPQLYFDEFSTAGVTTVAQFDSPAREPTISTVHSDEFPVQPVGLDQLLGGDARANAEILLRIFRGEDCGPKRDAIVLNAAAALFVARRADSIRHGWDLAVNLIVNGAAFAKLTELTER